MEAVPEIKKTKTQAESFSLLELCFPEHPDSEDYEFWDNFNSTVSWQEAIQRLSNTGAALAAKIHPDWRVIEVSLNVDEIYVQYERPLTAEELVKEEKRVKEQARRSAAAKLGAEKRKAVERDNLRKQLETIGKNHPDLLEEATLKLYE